MTDAPLHVGQRWLLNAGACASRVMGRSRLAGSVVSMRAISQLDGAGMWLAAPVVILATCHEVIGVTFLGGANGWSWPFPDRQV